MEDTLNESLEDVDSTFALSVAYNGRPFCGFARQPGQLTVQGELEGALRLLFRREVLTTCAGRTDSGVHAIGQTVSFDIAKDELGGRSLPSLLKSLNALTHDDIVVKKIEEKSFGFSARFDAKARKYKYFLSTSPFESMFMREFSWHVGDLDIDAMAQAATHLIGEHDFKSFCVAQSAIGKPTCRNISEINIERSDVLGDELAVITITGNAFLHSMVRTITGSLVAVGKGQREPLWIADVLSAKDRKAAGQCAPAQGLVFWEVMY